MEEEGKEHIYSDTVEEIISNEFPPLLRYGISILFGLFAILFSILFFVSYPYSVQVGIVLVQDSSSNLSPSQVITGEIHLDEKEKSKVKIGQEVILKIDAFPVNDFGVLKGVVDSISHMEPPSSILIRIKLTDTLFQTVKIESGMKGRAEFIIGEMSFIQRLSFENSIVN